MKADLTVPAVAGDFNIRIIHKGDSYGLGGVKTHAFNEPLVEFYDARYNHTELGQFVGRYYAGALLAMKDDTGLCLHSEEPTWTIPPKSMDLIRAELHQIKEIQQIDWDEHDWLGTTFTS